MRKKLIEIVGIMLGLSIVACKTNENANVSSEGIEITADSEIVADEEFEKEIAEKNANALEGQAIIDKYMNGEISEEDFLKMYGDFKELLEVLDETNEQNPIMKSGVVINPDTDGIMISSSELKSVLGLYNE